MNKTENGINNENSGDSDVNLTLGNRQTSNNPINVVSEKINEIVENALSQTQSQETTTITIEELFEKEEFSEEELKKISLLESKDFPTISLDNKAFAHILSDEIINEVQELVGNNIYATSKTLSSLLTALSSLSTNIEETEKFKQLAAQVAGIGTETKLQSVKNGLYQDQAKTIAEKVFDLKVGETYTMPGGWKGYPGHAMLYEFMKNEDGTLDILIYNTGSGTEYHQSKVVENKEKICAIKRYTGVTCEELFFAKEKTDIKPALFQKLIECQFLIDFDKNATVNADDIYMAFSHFKFKEIAVDHSFIDFSTKQRAGTCSFRVLEPYLFYHLTKNVKEYPEKIKLYKKTKYDLQRIALISFYKELENKMGGEILQMKLPAVSIF
jgi:hypothetical protein